MHAAFYTCACLSELSQCTCDSYGLWLRFASVPMVCQVAMYSMLTTHATTTLMIDLQVNPQLGFCVLCVDRRLLTSLH
jgi:hypothetical protein